MLGEIKKLLGTILLLASFVGVVEADVRDESNGQIQAPRRTFRSSYRAPAFSPYLNLLRDDVPAAINYFTLVRPQVTQEYINTREDYGIAGLKNEVSAEQRIMHSRSGSTNIRPTGRTGRFMDYSGHYLRVPGR